MQKCSWPGCPREQQTPYCYPHSRLQDKPSKAQKEQSLSVPDLLEHAQKEFNRFIRDRDRVKGCVTCGGQVTEAGHFIPVGENSALRFDEDNVHGQCSMCNQFKQGNREIYRAVMIQKYGQERINELENYPKYHKWSRPQLNNIIEQYSLKKKAA
jgi:hypothetical protein